MFAGTRKRGLTNEVAEGLVSYEDVRFRGVVRAKFAFFGVGKPNEGLGPQFVQGFADVGFAHAARDDLRAADECFGFDFQQGQGMRMSLAPAFGGFGDQMARVAIHDGAGPGFDFDDVQTMRGHRERMDFVAATVVGRERKQSYAAVRFVIGQGVAQPFERFDFVAMRRRAVNIETLVHDQSPGELHGFRGAEHLSQGLDGFLFRSGDIGRGEGKFGPWPTEAFLFA